jgi:hypothetical protein
LDCPFASKLGETSSKAATVVTQTALLARSVAAQANVLAYIDGFIVIGFAVIGMQLLMLCLRDPPTSRTPFAFQDKLKNGREIEQ